MKDFIALAACKGRCPVRISRTLRPRPHLINRLLANRKALRIICAPDGFGKTILATEYADTIFAFEGVFRQHMIVKGRNRDTAWFSIIDSEWPAVRSALEGWLAPDNFDPDGDQLRRLEDVRAGLWISTR